MAMSRNKLNAFWLLAALVLLPSFPFAIAADNPSGSAEKEKQLIEILRSDAPAAEKAITCKHLAVHGSSEAVPELAKLLPNEQLSSWARIALEAIPGKAADEALRAAVVTVKGRQLIGVINSIGVRRDAGSVETLTSRLQDADSEVASAAAVALGNIGDAAATKALRSALATAGKAINSAVAEGCVLCAERRLSEGNNDEAIQIYDEIRKADVPKQRIVEATRGAILARKDQGIPLLIEQLQSSDKTLFQLGLGTAREFPGDQVDKALATELERAPAGRASLIVLAMADRPKTVVLPAVVKAAGNGPKPVRIAALIALGRVGDASCVGPLLQVAADSDADLVQAAKAALSELPGDSVNKELVAMLDKDPGKIYPVLIELVGSRRISATPALVKAVGHSDKSVRAAALIALGNTVGPKDLSILIAQATNLKNADDAAVAQQALKTAAVRMPDREACAEQLATAMEKSPAATKAVLLQILGAVGGTKSLQAIATAARSNDALLQDTSTKLLGEWMTIDAAPVLLDLVKTAPGEKYQTRAIRGYIRIARQFVMPPAERAAMCEKAFAASRQSTEQKMVLEILKRYPSPDMLKIAVKAVQVPELKDEATQAAMIIAQKSGGKEENVRELLGKIGIGAVKLEIVKAEYGAGTNLKDVTEALRKGVSDLPLISLQAPFNESFGGDPAPGVMKKLKVQYKMNGKAAEATFAENDLIILPLPK
ncbi:MAG: hypothetical protein RIS70_202 [Planctomycetota bacterium]